MPATLFRTFRLPSANRSPVPVAEADAATEILKLLTSGDEPSTPVTDHEGTTMWF